LTEPFDPPVAPLSPLNSALEPQRFPGMDPATVAETWQPVPRRPDRVWIHVVLFLLTLGTTTVAGVGHYLAFLGNVSPVNFNLSLLWHGFEFSFTILAILGTHEMGHYLACRYYGVDATLPFFIPMPIPFTGTLGAVIRIRQPILDKSALFDIGVAGPIAGFLIAVPALLLGLHWSTLIPISTFAKEASAVWLGEPLLFKAANWIVWGQIPDSLSLNMHPIAFAAWFGLLMTALNLFPIAQLDGGHLSYAVFGSRIATRITFAAFAVVVGLTLVATTWIFWAVVLGVMLYMAGPRHPPVMDEHVPINRTRLWLAVVAVIIFAVCFTPAPIQPLDLLGH
jgi:membrane-associated protease RseP (regulator of RpoE activity)